MKNTKTLTRSIRNVAEISVATAFLGIALAIVTIICGVCTYMEIESLEKQIAELKSNQIVLSDIESIIDERVEAELAIRTMSIEEETVEVEEVQEEPDTVVVPTNVVHSGDILSNHPIDKDVFTETISLLAPNLSGIEDAILYNYETYGISPEFQLAVFCLESAYGTSKLAVAKNNLCGYRAYPTPTKTSYENATHFNTKSDCVIAFGETINNGYIQNNLLTFSEVSEKYCPPNSESWAYSVSSLKNKIEKTYTELYSEL